MNLEKNARRRVRATPNAPKESLLPEWRLETILEMLAEKGPGGIFIESELFPSSPSKNGLQNKARRSAQLGIVRAALIAKDDSMMLYTIPSEVQGEAATYIWIEKEKIEKNGLRDPKFKVPDRIPEDLAHQAEYLFTRHQENLSDRQSYELLFPCNPKALFLFAHLLSHPQTVVQDLIKLGYTKRQINDAVGQLNDAAFPEYASKGGQDIYRIIRLDGEKWDQTDDVLSLQKKSWEGLEGAINYPNEPNIQDPESEVSTALARVLYDEGVLLRVDRQIKLHPKKTQYKEIKEKLLESLRIHWLKQHYPDYDFTFIDKEHPNPFKFFTTLEDVEKLLEQKPEYLETLRQYYSQAIATELV